MHNHSDFYLFASGFWWLIFPIGWGLAGLVRVWIRHREAQAALEALKSYADRNQEPPQELVQLLKAPAKPPRTSRERARGMLTAGLFFTALGVAFLVLRLAHFHDNDPDNQAGLLFVVVLMGGFAVAMFATAYLLTRDGRSQKP